MLYFSNLDYPSSGNNLTVKYIQTSQRKSMPHYAAPFPILCRLLALLLAFAVGPTVVFAQEWDQDKDHEHHHANDPTGAWLIRNSEGQFILTVFHKEMIDHLRDRRSILQDFV